MIRKANNRLQISSQSSQFEACRSVLRKNACLCIMDYEQVPGTAGTDS